MICKEREVAPLKREPKATQQGACISHSQPTESYEVRQKKQGIDEIIGLVASQNLNALAYQNLRL